MYNIPQRIKQLMTNKNYLILFLLVVIATFFLVFTSYNDYTDVGVLNLKASRETIIQQTEKILSGLDISISPEYSSVKLFYDEEIADMLSEIPDHQDLKKIAPFYIWYINASSSPPENQKSIIDSERKNNQKKTSPSIELKIDNQLNLRGLFIPGRYFRDSRQIKNDKKSNDELIEIAKSFILKNSKLSIPAGITPTISPSGLSGTEGVEINWEIPFENSAISRQISIKIIGGLINSYSDNTVFPEKELTGNLIKNVISIASKVVLLILALLMLLNLYRQIRFGFADFKRSFWLGLLVCVGLILSQVFNNFFKGLPLIPEIVSLLYAVVVGLGIAMLYLAVEPLVRSLWPQKLKTIDILLSGVVFDRLLGKSIINGALVGFILICISFLISILTDLLSLNVTQHIHDFVKIMNVGSPSLAIIRGLLWRVPFVALTYFVFVPAFLLQLKLKPLMAIILSGLLSTLCIEPLFVLNPNPISLLMAFFTGVILVILFYKNDIVSVIFSVAVVFIVLRIPLFLQSGTNEYFYSGFIGLSLIGVPIIIAMVSILLDKEQDSKTEFLPHYLKRISEQAEMEKELQLAQSIQEHLQPRFPTNFGHLNFSSLFQPGQEVGGDSYDFIQLSDDYFLVVVFDISGHGFGAALLASHLQAKIRVYAKYEKRPDYILHELNQYLYKETPRQIFATMFMAIGSKKCSFQYASAGHNPPLIISEGKDVRFLKPTGVGLGMTSSATYSLGQFSLKPHDNLIIYTDGITEAMNGKKQEFGEDGLIKLFMKQRESTDFIQVLQDELRHFTNNGLQQDDQTLFLIQHKKTSLGKDLII